MNERFSLATMECEAINMAENCKAEAKRYYKAIATIMATAMVLSTALLVVIDMHMAWHPLKSVLEILIGMIAYIGISETIRAMRTRTFLTKTLTQVAIHGHVENVHDTEEQFEKAMRELIRNTRPEQLGPSYHDLMLLVMYRTSMIDVTTSPKGLCLVTYETPNGRNVGFVTTKDEFFSFFKKEGPEVLSLNEPDFPYGGPV